jgi:dolichyl-phosphate beta-glucosyltransferase
VIGVTAQQPGVDATLVGPVTGPLQELKPGQPILRPGSPPMTVILPVYHEAASLAGTIELVAEFARRHPACRFLFVDDGSRDATGEILRGKLAGEHAAAHAGVSFISYPDNRGKGHAIRTGIASLTGPGEELVVFMDGDMAYGLDHLGTMVELLGRFDVVIGSRKESPEERRNTRKLRRLMGWTFNKLVRVGLGLPYKDTQAGLKGFRLSAARAIFPRVTLWGFAFDVEALFIARQRGLRIGEMPARVARAHRRKPSNLNLFVEPLAMAGDLLRIRWNWLLGRYG